MRTRAAGNAVVDAALWVVCFGFLAATLAGCSRSGRPELPAAQTQEGVIATLATQPSPAHTGDDTLVLTLVDSNSHGPIGNANITASADALSPRLPGAASTGRAQGNGVYQVPVRLPIAGRYQVHVQVVWPAHRAATFTFLVDVAQ